ncbi:MAG: hypothetical protein NT023_22205 [Armatimonadetes bacterium]|nr:hypothetical protein [Armatimonadota bacterium]
MDLTLAVLADYANITEDGKLNIMGVFGEIKALFEFTALASEEALARLWDNPAEDEAWCDL